MKKLEPASFQLRRALICQSSCQKFCNKLTHISFGIINSSYNDNNNTLNNINNSFNNDDLLEPTLNILQKIQCSVAFALPEDQDKAFDASEPF